MVVLGGYRRQISRTDSPSLKLPLLNKITKAKTHKAKRKGKSKQKHKQKHHQVPWILNTLVQGLKTTVSRSVRGAKTAAVRVLEDWLDLKQGQNPSQIQNENENEDEAVSVAGNMVLLPPAEDDRTKTIVLDLDETLVHSFEQKPQKYDFCISVGDEKFYVLKRPGLDLLLEQLSDMYELVVFTAGVKEYAKPLLDVIDPQNTLIKHRLYRDSCTELVNGGGLVKDLGLLGRDLARVVIVDDNPSSYQLHPQNAVPVVAFMDYDACDSQLHTLLTFFNLAYDYDDLRRAISHYDYLILPSPQFLP